LVLDQYGSGSLQRTGYRAPLVSGSLGFARRFPIGTFIGVCLLAGAAVSWWLGWWSISTDKKKMDKDIGVAKHKFAEGFHHLEGKVPDGEKPLTIGQPIEGTIRAVDPVHHLLTVMGNKDEVVTVRTDDATNIRVAGQQGTIADLKVGDRAVVT
jgi:hypothetical protein